MISKNHMQTLQFSELDNLKFASNKVEYSKKINDAIRKSKIDAKLDNCYYCGRPCTSFCNSHSIPRFCLKSISIDGHLYYSNTLVDLPLFDDEKGLSQASTFHIICRDCDSKIFSEYEDPINYINLPTIKMLAQIAMKNYLLFISRRLAEISLYENMAKDFGKDFTQQQQVNNSDLDEFIREYTYAKKVANQTKWDDGYYLAFHQILDYVVPLAFQNYVTLVTDFEGQIINDIYQSNANYKTKDIHICIFPLESYSVIMLFIRNGEKRYSKFFKQFNKLSLEDKLKTICFIIFSYSEDVYIYKGIDPEILGSKELKELSQQTPNILTFNPDIKPIDEAVKAFDLNKMRSIPNILSDKYKVR